MRARSGKEEAETRARQGRGGREGTKVELTHFPVSRAWRRRREAWETKEIDQKRLRRTFPSEKSK